MIFFLQTALWSCNGLRTEIYREETLHLYQGACSLYKQGDFVAARSGFEEVIAIDPEYGPAYAGLGNLALIQEDYTGALLHYRKAIAADPELEVHLQPLNMIATAHKERTPLKEAGISLNLFYSMIMEDRLAEVEALLAENIPLLLLANDTMGITPGRLVELQRKVAESANPLEGSVRFRLFLGYLLFSGDTDDELAAGLIESGIAEAAGEEQQNALVVLGQIRERQGKANAAVDAYLSAVDAGLPMTDVAHHLARVYRVSIVTIISHKVPSTEGSVKPEPMHIEISTHLPPPQPTDLGAAAEPKDIRAAEQSGFKNTFY